MTNRSPRTEEPTFSYDIAPGQSPSEAVISAVAARTGATPVPDPSSPAGGGAVLEPLSAAICPDALDAVFGARGDGDARPGGRVTFPYHGHEVTVHGSERVSLEPIEGAAGGAAD